MIKKCERKLQVTEVTNYIIQDTNMIRLYTKQYRLGRLLLGRLVYRLLCGLLCGLLCKWAVGYKL